MYFEYTERKLETWCVCVCVCRERGRERGVDLCMILYKIFSSYFLLCMHNFFLRIINIKYGTSRNIVRTCIQELRSI